MNHKCRSDIGKQDQGQPYQVMNIFVIGNINLKKQGDDPQQDRVDVHRSAEDKLRGGSHRGNVCAKIENIGYAQEKYQPISKGLGVVLAEIFGYANSGNSSKPPANFLYGGHEGKREQHSPEHSETKLGTDLGIGGDAAWIVIGRSGDQARPQATKNVRRTLGRSENRICNVEIGRQLRHSASAPEI